MSGLDTRDLRILKHYADTNNRELYWNYLANKPGNDGYGLLALGVVRNDNAPGATANAHAAHMARARDQVQLSERGWNSFGGDLMKGDFQRRLEHSGDGRPDLALNLPANDVQRVHDHTFQNHKIDPDAWTPRELLQNAREKGGEAEAQRIWSYMLDNTGRGLQRMGLTSVDVLRYADGPGDFADYMGRMALARGAALVSRDTSDPDVIGATSFYVRRDKATGLWYEHAESGEHPMLPRRITDPRELRDLEDTRNLRLERQQQRQDFHPEDPNRFRPVLRSPRLLSDAGDDVSPDAPGQASSMVATSTDARDPAHPRHALYASTQSAVERLDASMCRAGDDASTRMTASLFALASERGFRQVDHALLSTCTGQAPAGAQVFIVQGDLENPGKLRAQMPTSAAIGTSVTESLQREEARHLTATIAPTFAEPQQNLAPPRGPVLARA